MAQHTEEELEERYLRLPPQLREALFSLENSQRIYEIGKKFGLNIEQIGILAQESGYVVVGITHPQDFTANLSEHLGVDLEKARAIAMEINHLIFYPMRELLKSTHNIEITQEQMNNNNASAPPVSVPRPSVPTPPAPRITEITPKPPMPAAATTPIHASAPQTMEPANEPRPPIPALPPSTTQQDKKISSIPPIVLSKLPGTLPQVVPASVSPTLQPPKQTSLMPPIVLKPLETKNSSAPPAVLPQPTTPSQTMETTMLQQRRVQPPSDMIHINESIFAPPNTPQESSPSPISPAAKIALPPSAEHPGRPQPSKPPPSEPASASYQKDPYREPVE